MGTVRNVSGSVVKRICSVFPAMQVQSELGCFSPGHKQCRIGVVWEVWEGWAEWEHFLVKLSCCTDPKWDPGLCGVGAALGTGAMLALGLTAWSCVVQVTKPGSDSANALELGFLFILLMPEVLCKGITWPRAENWWWEPLCGWGLQVIPVCRDALQWVPKIEARQN